MNCLLYYCIYFEYFSEFCNFEDFILPSMQIKFILMKKNMSMSFLLKPLA